MSEEASEILLSNVSAYGTNWPDCIREGFWLIVVTEGNEDETETDIKNCLTSDKKTLVSVVGICRSSCWPMKR